MRTISSKLVKLLYAMNTEVSVSINIVNQSKNEISYYAGIYRETMRSFRIARALRSRWDKKATRNEHCNVRRRRYKATSHDKRLCRFRFEGIKALINSHYPPKHRYIFGSRLCMWILIVYFVLCSNI